MSHDDRNLRIALFIDFENLVTRTGLTPETFDLQPALDMLLEKGKVVFRRAYCDWSRFAAAKKNLHEKGVELIDVPPSTRAGKNGADMRLVIDALELNYQREHIDAFAIASGDSDFCPLAYKLRENNRYVIGLAVREASSPLFVKACDEFLYIRPHAVTAAVKEKASVVARRPRGRQTTAAAKKQEAAEAAVEAPVKAAPALAPEPAPAPAPKVGRNGKAAKGAKAAKPAKPAPVIPAVAREASAAILARATEPVNPSRIKEAIVRKQPDFDVREHGFSTFSRLLEAMEQEGLLRREAGAKGQWYVLPPA